MSPIRKLQTLKKINEQTGFPLFILANQVFLGPENRLPFFLVWGLISQEAKTEPRQNKRLYVC